MKKLLLVALLSLIINFSFCQKYESYKQEYLKGRGTEFTDTDGYKSIIVKTDSLFVDLLDGEKFKGKMTFSGEQKYHGKKGNRYNLQFNKGLIVIYEDEIFFNLRDSIALSYYLTNYTPPTKEQIIQQEAKDKAATYEWNVKMYGKLTADCIKDSQVRVGMNYSVIEEILGEPISRKLTETTNSVYQIFVYSNMIIYTMGSKVIRIEHTIK